MTLKLAALTIVALSAIGLAQADSSSNPFSSQETQIMSGVWPKIREARDFDDINWRAIRDDDGDSRTLARHDLDDDTGPFTRSEAEDLRKVWPEIRKADAFEDIDWRSVGLDRAPGDRDAREFMADHWKSLKRADRFDDIDWRVEDRDR